MRRFFLAALVVAGLLVSSGLASAFFTPIGPPSGGEQSLALILDTLYGAGNYARVDDGWDQIWYNPDGTAKAKARYAGDTQDFGFIAGTVGMVHTKMFNVGNPQGYNPTITPYGPFTPDGNGWFNFTSAQSGSYFRFGNDSSNGPLFSSRMSDNVGDSGKDHMVAWKITGTSIGFENNIIGNFAIAFEDRNLMNPDYDYNDLVVEIGGGLMPTPEPGSVVLLGIVVLGGGIAAMRRRKR